MSEAPTKEVQCILYFDHHSYHVSTISNSLRMKLTVHEHLDSD